MSLNIFAYLIYLFSSMGLTYWVGKALFKYGRPFLVEIYHGNQKLADAVNQLLLVGFYLLNIGYVALSMKMGMNIQNFEQMLEELSFKIGLIVIVLAGIHFMNLSALFRLSRKNRTDEEKLVLS